MLRSLGLAALLTVGSILPAFADPLSSIEGTRPNHRPTVRLVLEGNFKELAYDRSVQDFLFKALLELRPALRQDDIHWLTPRKEGEETVYDLVDGRPSISMELRRLGRYKVDRRARTYRAVLTVYQ